MTQKHESNQRAENYVWLKNITKRARTWISGAAQVIRGRYSQTKNWRGFGVLSGLYIALWICLFVFWYNPWQINVALGGGWQLPFAEGIAMFLYLVPGLIILPGALYVLWTNLLRKTPKA